MPAQLEIIKDLMIKEVVTTTPEVLIEEAATVMVDKDITVLPVLNEKNEITGIITYKDIFKALIDLTGYKDKGNRVIIEVKKDSVGVIAEISKALADHDIDITRIFVNRPEDLIEITIQTTGKNGKESRQILESLGYKVFEI